MQFRLTYRGPLPPQSTHSKPELVRAKHAIRQQLHVQLVDLCAREPVLLLLVAGLRGAPDTKHALSCVDTSMMRHDGPSWQDFDDIRRGLFKVGEKFRFNGFEFIPIAIDRFAATCELDILFLRRERPGTLITKPKDEYGGDLDNRLKLFLDALRCPTGSQELPAGATPGPQEEPFLCLLEDDSLITKFQVESDTLLGGATSDEGAKDVHLVAKVVIRFTRKSRLSELLP